MTSIATNLRGSSECSDADSAHTPTSSQSSCSVYTPSSSQSSGECSETAPSLLSRLKQAPQSILTRKRRVAQNLPHDGKRRKAPKCTTEPKSVTADQRVKEFPDEKLTVSSKKLFCSACREEVAVKKSIIEQHLKSEKHIRGKGKVASKEKREQDIAEALKLYDKDVHPVGETLSSDQRVYRVKVVSTFLKAGVPLNKLDVFQDLLEENGYRLAGRHPMSDLIPFILSEEKHRVKDEIADKDVSVIFDGTSRLGEAVVVVIRFVSSDTWCVEQRIVRMQLLGKTMCGEELARELIGILSTELGIPSARLLAGMRDRASTNGVAMRMLKIVYPSLLDVGCFSHTIDHVGDHFVVPILDDFSRLWIGIFAHSPKARLLWREKTGRTMSTYSETRWWSRWEVLHQTMLYFGDIAPFLQENDLSPAGRGKILAILADPQKKILLQIELAVVVDVGEQFVKATYSLEGDGPLVFSSFEILSTLNASIHAAHLPNTQAVIHTIARSNSAAAQQLMVYAKKCVEPGLKYYQDRFAGELSCVVAAFKAARLFLPQKVDEMKPDASMVDTLKAFPFLNTSLILDGLKQELPSYLAKAEDISADTEPLAWWKKHAGQLPRWSSAACKVALVQPSSAAAERVFSLLKSTFGPQQDLSLQDYIECSLMLQYNKR